MPHVDRLGGFAGEEAERRQVAEGVAGDQRGEGVADAGPGSRVQSVQALAHEPEARARSTR